MSENLPTAVDLVAYLDALLDRYPGGVPERYIREYPVQEGRMRAAEQPQVQSSLKCIFVISEADSQDAPMKLFHAALGKGLGWTKQEALIVVLGKEVAAEEFFRFASTKEVSDIMVLGAAVWNSLRAAHSDLHAFSRGASQEVRDFWILPTHDLCKICECSEKGDTLPKKEFWFDLLQLKELREIK